MESIYAHKALLPTGWASDVRLVVRNGRITDLVRGTRNLPRAKWLAPEGLNVYDILNHPTLVMTKATVEKVTEALRP